MRWKVVNLRIGMFKVLWSLGRNREYRYKFESHQCIDITTAAAVKSLQLCPTLCDPIDGRPPDSPAPGILQARTLEWVAISFSSA